MAEILIAGADFVLAAETLVVTLSQVNQRAHEGVLTLTGSEIRQNRKLREVHENIDDAAQKAEVIFDHVEYITQIVGDKNGIIAIITQLVQTTTERRRFWRVRRLFRRSYEYEVPNPDYKSLKCFIDRLQKAFRRIKKANLDFTKNLQTALQATNDAIDDCTDGERQARLKKKNAETTGALATMFIATVTAVTTIMIGGPPLAIPSTVAVVQAGSAVTNTIKEEYAQLQEAFKCQRLVLDKWYQSAREMKKNVAEVHRAVERLAIVVDDLEQSQPDQIHIRNLCCTLEQLTTSFANMNSKIKKSRTRIRKANKQMDAGLKTITAM